MLKKGLGSFKKGTARMRSASDAGASSTEVVLLNVGGSHFSTTRGTLLKSEGSRLSVMFVTEEAAMEALPRDADGRCFIDRDGTHFGLILNYLRDGDATFPAADSDAFAALQREVDWYGLYQMSDCMVALSKRDADSGDTGEGTGAAAGADADADGDRARGSSATSQGQAKDVGKSISAEEQAQREELAKIEALRAQLKTREQELRVKLEGKIDERTKDLLTLELQQVGLEQDRVEFKQTNGRDLIYNLLIVGVTGSGKSSSLNSLLDQQTCEVSGAQAQGTRGCVLRDATLDSKSFISFIDSQFVILSRGTDERTTLLTSRKHPQGPGRGH